MESSQSSLLDAARQGNIDELNRLIRSNGHILEEIDLEAADSTPLHVACEAGHLDFVRELLKSMPQELKPKFTENLNADGLSPLHIAAARGDVKIASELLTVGRNLCFVTGREGRIPLHLAVVSGQLEVMKLLLSDSPDSMEVKTTRNETALHFAVKNNRLDAISELVDHLKQHKKEQVINWKDNQGNTALRLAVAVKNFEVVESILRQHGLEYEVVEVNASNESGSTPPAGGAQHRRGRSNLPASSLVSEVDQSLGERVTNAPQSPSRFPSRNLNREKKESMGDVRNALLVVAALIANATYQTVLQPPSFTTEVDNAATKDFLTSYASWMTGSLGKDLAYMLFITGNTFGLLVSVQMIICLTRDLPVKLPMLLSMAAMVQTYCCYTYYLPFKLLEKEFGLKNVELLSVLPLTTSILLLMVQRRLALALDFYLERLSQFDLVGDMYNIWA